MSPLGDSISKNGKLAPWMVEGHFVQDKGYSPYSNATLEFIISSADAPRKERVFCLIVRQAWGWDSPFAVKWQDRKTGANEPYSRADIAEKLGLDPSHVSKLCAELEEEGRLLPDTGRLLYPSGNPIPLERPAEKNRSATASLKKTILRFIPKFPLSKLTESGNLEKAALAISRYKQSREDAKAEYKRAQQAAEQDMKNQLWALVNWQGGDGDSYITDSLSTHNSRQASELVDGTSFPLGPPDAACLAASLPSESKASASEPAKAPGAASAAAVALAPEVQRFVDRAVAALKDCGLPTPPKDPWWADLYQRIVLAEGHHDHFLHLLERRAQKNGNQISSWGYLLALVPAVAGGRVSWRNSHRVQPPSGVDPPITDEERRRRDDELRKKIEQIRAREKL